jgi:hypothetical protein
MTAEPIELIVTLCLPDETLDLLERLVTVLEDEYEQKYTKEEDNDDEGEAGTTD